MARKPKIETAETVPNEAKRRAAAVLAAAADDFATLTRAAGLDPARHWCRVDLRGIDFGDDDLFGFKFVGADLRAANVSHARHIDLSMFKGTKFDADTTWPLEWRAAIAAGALDVDVRLAATDPDFVRWVTQNVPEWADTWGRDQYGAWAIFSVPDSNGHPVLQRMRWIEPGNFRMGSPSHETHYLSEQPRHKVIFSDGFWMFDTVCTDQLWNAVMNRETETGTRGGFPITHVSWNDAQKFVATLNAAKPGLDLTLPSEAMWEYCCRAGTISAYSFGDEITHAQVRFQSESAAVVGSLMPNDWGLHEMHGNVWEWCADTWHGNYKGAPNNGAAWTDRRSASHVVRGGSWGSNGHIVRAAVRVYYRVDDRYDIIGFRCARVQAKRGGA